jgi:molybdate transport system substrate-binding protein
MGAIVIAVAALWMCLSMSEAAEIKVISANGMRDVIAETRAKFEAETKHQLTVTVVETGEIRRRVQGGELFDVIMVPRNVADEFETAGKVVPGSAVALIRVDFGIAVPSDGPRPNVSTPEALKDTLLRAKTILITDPTTGGISGVHAMDVFNKLGIADQMKSRVVTQPGGTFHAKRVVQGEADIALQAEHEIRCVKGATFLPYPVQFQRTIVFMGAIGSSAGSAAAAAKTYLAFMTGAETANTYSAHCLIRG